ncbi:MAG TPA: 3-hydroxybutyryl-CoA dehydrogenase [Acidimicrobiales bacterium]|nr:MAG: 3-hydroxybutyryl-CoA dehydrogenase [Actinobacteria bacterium 21-64-8]HQU00152.1 3-hydroxybutyryl-CoA dehydrogenase [Acidimicrobiales bacterium]
MERVGVVGCGLMGSGIAEVSARAGATVVVIERDVDALERGRARIEKSLSRAVSAGKMPEAEADLARANLIFDRDFRLLTDSEIVIEAVAEDEATKVEVFRRLDDVVQREDAILATNTSSIPIIKLAMATKRPEQVIGLHFFNPVPVLKLVEVISSLLTSAETTTKARSFATEQLNKKVITSPDRAGFVVNALLIPYLLSAIRMLESGFASAEDIDTGMIVGCAHPLGPLALTDLIGLDTTLAVAESLYEEFKEPHLAPPPLLSRMTQAGLLGRKSGQGFYGYRA